MAQLNRFKSRLRLDATSLAKSDLLGRDCAVKTGGLTRPDEDVWVDYWNLETSAGRSTASAPLTWLGP